MKKIVSISLGTGDKDYEFATKFLGQDFHIRRFGTDRNLEKAADILVQWDKKADAIGLGNVKFPYDIGPEKLTQNHSEKLKKLTSQIKTPVVTGENLRRIGHERTLRHIQFKFGGNYFNNARVLFFSGMTHYTMAKVMSEYTDNLAFADPILENCISKILSSLKELEIYAKGFHDVLKWFPGTRLNASGLPLRRWNGYIMRKSVQKANIIVIPCYDFRKYAEKCPAEDLRGKTVISSTISDDRVQFLKKKVRM